MNRVLKRPMFRGGGSADGITSGLDQKPRQEYSRGTMPDFQLGGLPGFLTGFGLNLLAEPPRGNIFQTAAIAARDPFNQLQKFQTAQAIKDEDIAREEKQLAEGREFTESMTDKEIIKWLAETLDCGTWGERKVLKGRKRQWRWRCSHRDAFFVARLLWPYVKVKLHKIEKIIEGEGLNEIIDNLILKDRMEKLEENE